MDKDKLVQFDKYDKHYTAEDMMGIPCIGEGCTCRKHKKEDEEK